MLRHFIQKVHQNRWAHPRVVVCVPSGVTGVEKRAVEEATLSAGARSAFLIEEPMAAAIGAGLPVAEPTGNMVVDIGGGTTEVAVISLGGIVVAQSIRVGGDELDEAIISYVKKEYKLMIGSQTAEEVKLEIGSAYPLREEVQAEIRGRDMITGLPKTVVLSSEDVREALEEPMQQIIDAVKSTLDKTPPELASDIMDRGIMMAGGGSLLQGLDERLRRETEMPIHVAESPLTCVAVGSGARWRSSRSCRRPRPTADTASGTDPGTPTPQRSLMAVPATSGIARRRATVRRGVIAALAIVCLVIFTGYFREGDEGPLHDVQATSASVIAPVQEGATRAVEPFRDAWGWMTSLRDARDRAAALQEQIDDLQARVADGAVRDQRLTELESLLGIDALLDTGKELGGYRREVGLVIQRSVTDWYRSARVDVGSSSTASCATPPWWRGPTPAPRWSATSPPSAPTPPPSRSSPTGAPRSAPRSRRPATSPGCSSPRPPGSSS